jgi:hypothetical protein
MAIPKLVATCFGLTQPSSGQYRLKTKQLAKYKICTQWDPIMLQYCLPHVSKSNCYLGTHSLYVYTVLIVQLLTGSADIDIHSN